MELKSLRDLFVHQLQDIYNAEGLLLKAMPEWRKKVSDLQLIDALENHITETENQLRKLDEVFELINETPQSGRKCPAMEGIIEEGKELMKLVVEPDVLDAGIISIAQRAEHYEIANYGTVRVFARQLAETEAEEVLNEILEEEKNADMILSELADPDINRKAQRSPR